MSNVKDEIVEQVEEAIDEGVRPDNIEYVINVLRRGAKGRRFGVMLSVNGVDVWAGEAPLLRVDYKKNQE
jgi:hypothetical protein